VIFNQHTKIIKSGTILKMNESNIKYITVDNSKSSEATLYYVYNNDSSLSIKKDSDYDILYKSISIIMLIIIIILMPMTIIKYYDDL
jgi:hypothetical protein